jgi:hypothetical protein
LIRSGERVIIDPIITQKIILSNNKKRGRDPVFSGWIWRARILRRLDMPVCGILIGNWGKNPGASGFDQIL